MKHILAASESMPRSIFKNFLFSHTLVPLDDVRVRRHVHVHVQPLPVLAPSTLNLSLDPRWCTALLQVARNITYK